MLLLDLNLADLHVLFGEITVSSDDVSLSGRRRSTDIQAEESSSCVVVSFRHSLLGEEERFFFAGGVKPVGGSGEVSVPAIVGSLSLWCFASMRIEYT